MPKLGESVKLQSIAQINGLPTIENDPDGPLGVIARRYRGTFLQIIVSKQEALDRMKTLVLPPTTTILLETSSSGDGLLYLRMYFEFKYWGEIKKMMTRVGFTYEEAPRGLPPSTGHIGEFFME